MLRKEIGMRKVVTWVVLLMFGVIVGGCASMEKPNVAAYPTKGQTAEQQSKDMSECQAWAKQQTGFDPAKDTGVGAAVGGLVGAAGGAALGAAVGAASGGGAGRGAAIGAAAGGITGIAGGGAIGYSKSKDGYEKAYAACMGARGYSVQR